MNQEHTTGPGYPFRLYRRFRTPARAPEFERPEDHRLTPRPFQVETADRVTIRGWAFEPDAPWGVVILCHARSAGKSRVLRQAALLHTRGLTVVTFDFRGCGESDPPPRASGISLRAPLHDLEAVARHVLREHGDDEVLRHRIALMGCSFGGNMAIAHAGTAGRHYPAVILDSTPLVRWQDMLRTLLRDERRGSRAPRLRAALDHAVIHAVVLRTRAEALYRQAQRSARNLGRTDLLLIVGERDTFFDIEEGCRFLDRHYAGHREVWRVRRGRHLTNHLVDPEGYGDRIVTFLRSAFTGTGPSELRATNTQEPR
ncbi:alpha/beta hydrolase [Streptomyces sp. NPDC018833]|uniref:alpha/beta hydrolase n=1 Tax=Streptomyces sp. NPDC018833 TaxID=3365053 RepID=UPI0037AFA73E